MKAEKFTSEKVLVTDDSSDVELAFGIINEINSFRALCAEDPQRGLDESDAWLQSRVAAVFYSPA